MSKYLFVVGGLVMGGVETYIVRLAIQLSKMGHNVTVLLLSRSYDADLMQELIKAASVEFHSPINYFHANSWLNGLIPFNVKRKSSYDIIHVVDLLTLSFIFLNKKYLTTKYLTIGIYHSAEIFWWRNDAPYFRKKMLLLFDKNAHNAIYPNEVTASMAASVSSTLNEKFDVVPIGIDLTRYASIKSGSPERMRKIVSVGRLVEFKTYNWSVISELSSLRELGDYQYFIYGTGPNESLLRTHAMTCGVDKYVHFIGHVNYEKLPTVLQNAFCFVGSGTTIIEAAAAGVPSLVGIETVSNGKCGGFFCDIIGFSYNEIAAFKELVKYEDMFLYLHKMNSTEYSDLSEAHRAKASSFDIKNTATAFHVKSLYKFPEFDISFNRWVALMSLVASVLIRGNTAFKRRFDNPVIPP